MLNQIQQPRTNKYKEERPRWAAARGRSWGSSPMSTSQPWTSPSGPAPSTASWRPSTSTSRSSTTMRLVRKDRGLAFREGMEVCGRFFVWFSPPCGGGRAVFLFFYLEVARKFCALPASHILSRRCICNSTIIKISMIVRTFYHVRANFALNFSIFSLSLQKFVSCLAITRYFQNETSLDFARKKCKRLHHKISHTHTHNENMYDVEIVL